MAGRVQPIEEIIKGESKTLLFTVLDDDYTQSTIIVVKGEPKIFKGARQDLSGATAIEWQLGYPTGAPYTPVVSKSLGAGIELEDQNDPDTKGDLTVTIEPGDTEAIVAKTYKHDLFITIAGQRKCVIRPSDCPVREPVNDA
jgi:hypothetical protein